MEISNEVYRQMFGVYCNSDFKYLENALHRKIKYCTIYGILGSGSTKLCKYDHCKLILTPLSEISDEDAIEVSKLAMWHWDKEYNCYDETIADNVEHNEFGIHIDVSARCFEGYVSIHDGCVFVSDEDTELETPVMSNGRIIDFLRSKGYDCGFMHIKSLIDAGIAISSLTPHQTKG